jgi:hypothetical protein
MNAPVEMTIEISRTKISFLILGSIGFVLAGVWMVNLDDASIRLHGLLRSPVLMHGVGYLGIGFFGLCGLIAVKKFFEGGIGLQFSKDGFIDHSRGASARFIPWSEVSEVGVFEFRRQRMLVIKVIHPEKYAEIDGSLKRWAYEMNLKMYGSPIVISSSALKIGFAELQEIFRDYIKRYSANA